MQPAVLPALHFAPGAHVQPHRRAAALSWRRRCPKSCNEQLESFTCQWGSSRLGAYCAHLAHQLHGGTLTAWRAAHAASLLAVAPNPRSPLCETCDRAEHGAEAVCFEVRRAAPLSDGLWAPAGAAAVRDPSYELIKGPLNQQRSVGWLGCSPPPNLPLARFIPSQGACRPAALHKPQAALACGAQQQEAAGHRRRRCRLVAARRRRTQLAGAGSGGC